MISFLVWMLLALIAGYAGYNSEDKEGNLNVTFWACLIIANIHLVGI